MLGIHNNLSAGAQNVTCYRRLCNNYACLQVLVNNILSSCVIANKQKLFVQGYNLEVHDVIKYNIVPL